jgi:ubiquitin C-terminal hydrolase
LLSLFVIGVAAVQDVMLDTGDGQFVRYAVRAVVCKSGGVCDGHYVVVCRQDVRDVRGNASIQWWLLDDADVSIVRPSGAPGRLSDDCIFTAFTPCLLACDAMNS